MEYTTPSGFRDVWAQEAAERERIARRVQDLFAANGYEPLETPTLERMDVMEAGGRVPASPFKFFDAASDLVALRPDVTLQVARMCSTRLRDVAGPLRFRYMQRVFRDTGARNRAEVREKKQIGIECIGPEGPAADAEVIGLFAQALKAAGVERFTISLATVAVLRALLSRARAAEAWKAQVLEAFHQSNFVALDDLCREAPAEDADLARAIASLSRIAGGREAIDEAQALAEPFGCAGALDSFRQTYDELERQGLGGTVVVDFSVMSSFDYYTGAVFQGFAEGLGAPLGGGGRYDSLLGLFGTDRPAAGFAFYLEDAMVAAAAQAAGQDGAERPLRIAVPKGSLNADAIAVLAGAGLDVAGLDNPGRSLIVRNPGVDYIIVRPSDAPVFVEMGAADCGICGEDSLLESAADVMELADLRFGACRFVVAQLAGTDAQVQEHYRQLGSLRVATKYPRIARAHFARRGTQVEVVQLHGNIELGPLTGMSECIVDITATGTTLRENNLEVTDEVLSSTARFFANSASVRTDPRVRALARRLRDGAADRALKVTAGGSA